MERIAMSQEERDRLDWLKRARDGKMTQREAAERMGLSERWVRKLLRRMKTQGDTVVVHGLRGRASNRKLAAKTKKQALVILREPDWHDFGPANLCLSTVGQAASASSGQGNASGVDDRSRDVEAGL